MNAGVGMRLREERLKSGLNQTDFGRIGGVSRDSQNQYETEKTPPKTDYLVRLGAEGVDVGYVLTGSRAADSLSPAESAIVSKLQRLAPAWCQVVDRLLDQALAENEAHGLSPEVSRTPSARSPDAGE